MSKMSKAAASLSEANSLRLGETTTNFMGGDSYVLNPLTTMKMVTASSIFGEPQYYRESSMSNDKYHGTKYVIDRFVTSILPSEITDNATTEEVMIRAIDAALDYDFAGTLDWAVTLRETYHIRLNPQIIMVRAAIHPKRVEFTTNNPGTFNDTNMKVMQRPDEPMTQLAIYLYFNKGSKKNLPNILKRTWAKKLSKLKAYSVAKYKTHETGMINAVRICHATSKPINELMQTGTVEVAEDEKTWENMRSAGMSWKEIISQVNMGHMAMLRNLRGVFSEIDDYNICKEYLDKLKAGVVDGKQLPFRYYSALKAINSKTNHEGLIIDALEECMDIAMENFPKLSGKTVCLSDNSGSAWFGVTSEYGTTVVAEINNLSSVMTAANSDEGYVVSFGDTTKTYAISKRVGILSQANKISDKRGNDVGLSTEGGIWEFFNNAIKNKVWYDNIFIYSDQQAGHGGLYGTLRHRREYNYLGYSCNDGYINVFKLVQDYRKKVNPKVNVFSVQTAGYNNNLLPEYAYRTSILYGWTGREAEFAKAIIDLYNSNESVTCQ